MSGAYLRFIHPNNTEKMTSPAEFAHLRCNASTKRKGVRAVELAEFESFPAGTLTCLKGTVQCHFSSSIN